MRTTVTLDPDTEALLRRTMQEHQVSFKQALNDLIRAGAPNRPQATAVTRVRSLGSPRINLDRALQVAAQLEDDELTRRLQVGK